MLPVFMVFPLLAIWVYRDSRRLRDRGVKVYPGLVATAYLVFLVVILFFNIQTRVINGYNLFIPLAVYLLFRIFSRWFIKASGMSPSLSPRWSFWLFAIALPVLSIAFYVYTFGWMFSNLGGH